MKKVRRIFGGRLTKQPEPPSCDHRKDISIMNDTLFDLKETSNYFKKHYEAEKEAHKLSDTKVTQLTNEVREEKRTIEDQACRYAAEKGAMVDTQVRLENELQSVKTDRDEKTCQLQEASDRATRLSDEKDRESLERQRVEVELNETQGVVQQLEGEKDELRSNIDVLAFEKEASESLQQAELNELEQKYKEEIKLIRSAHNMERFVMNEEFELDMAGMKAKYTTLTGRIEEKANEDRQRLLETAYEKLMNDCKERETLLEERYQKEKAERKKDAFEWLLKKEQLEEQLGDYMSALCDLRSENKTRELSLVNNFDSERASLNQKHLDTVAELRVEIENLQDLVKRQREQGVNCRSKITETRIRLRVERTIGNVMVAEAEGRHLITVTSKDLQIESAEEELSISKARISYMRERTERIQQALETANSENELCVEQAEEIIFRQLDELQAKQAALTSANATIATLQVEVDELKNSRDKSEAKFGSLEALYQAKVAELTGVYTNAKVMQDELDKETQLRESYQAKYVSIEQLCLFKDTALTEANAMTRTLQEKLKEADRAVWYTNDMLQSKMEEAEWRIHELCGELARRMQELSETTAELNSARGHLSIFKQEIDFQNDEMKAMASRLKDHTSKLDIANDKIVELHGKIYRMNIESKQTESDYEIQLGEARGSIEDYTSQLSVEVKNRQQLVADVMTAKVRIGRLEVEQSALKGKLYFSEVDAKRLLELNAEAETGRRKWQKDLEIESKKMECVKKELNTRERLVNRKEVDAKGEQSRMRKRRAEVEKQEVDLGKIQKDLKEFETKLEEERVRIDTAKEDLANLERQTETEAMALIDREKTKAVRHIAVQVSMERMQAEMKPGHVGSLRLKSDMVSYHHGKRRGRRSQKERVTDELRKTQSEAKWSHDAYENLPERANEDTQNRKIAEDGEAKIGPVHKRDGAKVEPSVDSKEGLAHVEEKLVNAAAFELRNVSETAPAASIGNEEKNVKETAPAAGIGNEEKNVKETAPAASIGNEEKNVKETTPAASIGNEEKNVKETAPAAGIGNEETVNAAALTVREMVATTQGEKAKPPLTYEDEEAAKINSEEPAIFQWPADTELLPTEEEQAWMDSGFEEDRRKVVNWEFKDYVEASRKEGTEMTEEQADWMEQRVDEREMAMYRMSGVTEEEDSWLDQASQASYNNVQHNNLVYFTPYQNAGTQMMNSQSYVPNYPAPTGHYSTNSASYGGYPNPNNMQSPYQQRFTQPRQTPQQGPNFSGPRPRMQYQQSHWYAKPRGSGQPRGGNNTGYPRGGYNGGQPLVWYGNGQPNGGYSGRRQTNGAYDPENNGRSFHSGRKF